MRTRAVFHLLGCLVWTSTCLNAPAAAQQTLVVLQVRGVPTAPLPLSSMVSGGTLGQDPSLGVPPLGSETLYDSLLDRQKAGEILDLSAVTRPGIAFVSEGRLGVAQGSGRFEILRPGESMDLFVPQGAVLPAGAVVLQDNVPAETVLKANLLSSRGEAGTNPELVGFLTEGKTFTRVLAPRELVDAPLSRVAHEVAQLRALLEDPTRGWDGDSGKRTADVLASPAFNGLSLRGQLDVLRRLAGTAPASPVPDSPQAHPVPELSGDAIGTPAPGSGGWTGRVRSLFGRVASWMASLSQETRGPRLELSLETLSSLPERLRALARQGDLKGLLNAVEKPLPEEAARLEEEVAAMSAADGLLRALKAALAAAYLSGMDPSRKAPAALAAHFRTEKQSGPTCAFHALFNALKLAGKVAEDVTPEGFAAYGRSLLGDESKGRDRGLTHEDIGTLARKLGLGIRAQETPASATAIRRLLAGGKPALGVLRYFKQGSGLHGYEDVEHAILVRSAFYSKSQREWMFAVEDSGPGLTTFYDWPSLRILLEKIYLLDIPEAVAIPAVP